MKARLSSVLLIFALLCGPAAWRAGARAQSGADAGGRYASAIREFEEFVRAQMERDRIPGMTVGFSRGDYTWVKGFGYADLENRTPAHAESAYRLASVTKAMTGAAVVQLAERGRLDLDAEIQTYVPDYPKQKWPVTVRQLLTHTGGGQTGSGLGPEHVTTKEVVARIAKHPIEVEPGTKFVYGTAAYNLLGAAVENVSGQSFEAYLREHLWLPLGMRETRIDSVRDLIPHRVRGYDLAAGEVKNAPFVDVSSRFGGGGATGTVPDLLRFARGAFAGKVLSPRWAAEMLKPVATKAGRWSGLGDGDEFYTLGWLVRPVNGRFAVYNEGSQKGTDTAFFYFPNEDLAIAAACNLELGGVQKYITRLYELLTGASWEVRVYTREQRDAPVARALGAAYNFGALHFNQHRRPLAADDKELAEAFAYFNASAGREPLRAEPEAAARRVRDGRHPVGHNAFVKVGSYAAARLAGKHGPASLEKFYAVGPVPFFAEYVRLYRADASVPRAFRFTPAFEQLIERWDADWARTWDGETRRVAFTQATDFAAVGARLRRQFAGAEVYPDFTHQLQPIQQGMPALYASKLGVDLYPHSDELLFNWAYFAIITEQTEEGRAALKQVAPQAERPVAYFKRAHAANPRGVMRAATFLDIGRRWLARPQMYPAAVAFVSAGLEVHPAEAALHELLGDFLTRKGERERAAESYRKAFGLDPKLGKGATAEEYVAARLSATQTEVK